ncbi:sigma-70 family RNA polymerase sigma factor [Rhizobiaceae bacterium BDR2-2]|uniref:Sigma-70 family RNA polymerase sigma factor n=1 Tax=Ectorhizobium quercum TaxID=2965071 RepID=A0AAE3MYM9_9HYPH|nr:sigma-70 family RNA polymerase sigma factor [Ectorhizobium quercum]
MAPPQETDTFVRLAKAGDVAAFERLVALHYPFILKTAFRWLGHRSDAEDVTQSVCMRLATILPGFDGRASFTSWLYRVTLNAVRDFQRSQQRRRQMASRVALIAPEKMEPDQENRMRVEDIWRRVRELPEKQRDAVLLVYGEHLSHAEAARIMQCKEVTVSWHIHKARKSLRDLL